MSTPHHAKYICCNIVHLDFFNVIEDILLWLYHKPLTHHHILATRGGERALHGG